MQIRRYTDPQLFRSRCMNWLLESELKNSSTLAVTQLLTNGDHPFEPPYYLAIIESDDSIIGCAVRTPPDSLILASIPVETIPLLATDIATVYDSLPGVTGMEIEAQAFAKQWQRQRGNSAIVNHWRWYALDEVITPEKSVAGSLRLADESDLDLVRSWAPRFANETDTLLDVAAFYERRVKSGSLYLWLDEEPRSLVAVSSPTPNSIRLSGVYTARDFRRKGYATNAVASVSQLMLDAGYKYCLLFADKADSYANHMYHEIGYDPIFDNVNIRLSD